MLHITEKEVEIYRDIYYEHVKPALIQGKSQEEVNTIAELVCETFGMDINLYKALGIIDFMQRFANDKNVSFEISGQRIESLKAKDFLKSLPQLKCPRRTEQKDL